MKNWSRFLVIFLACALLWNFSIGIWNWEQWLCVGIAYIPTFLLVRHLIAKLGVWVELWRAQQDALLESWQERRQSLEYCDKYVFPNQARDFVGKIREAVAKGEFTLEDVYLSEGYLWYLLSEADFLETLVSKDLLSSQRMAEIGQMIDEWNSKAGADDSYSFLYSISFASPEDWKKDDELIASIQEDAKKLNISFQELKAYHEQVFRHREEEEVWWDRIQKEDNPWSREQKRSFS